MALPSALRPRREFAFPFAATLAVLAWFARRNATIRPSSPAPGATAPSAVAFAALAVVASYLVAASLVAAAPDRRAPSWAAPLVAPSDATLRTLAALVVCLAGFAAVWLLAPSPAVDAVAAAVGGVVGWPLALAVLVTYALGTALGTALPFAVEAGFVAVGVAGAVAWLFVLSSWLATLGGALGDRITARST